MACQNNTHNNKENNSSGGMYQKEETTPIFLSKEVEGSCKGGSELISSIFQSLFLQHKKQQKDLVDYLNFDKAYISRICNGKEIPILRVRLKIAEFFSVDSSLIWRVKDMDLKRDYETSGGG